MAKDVCIIIFAKAPVAGYAKTRMIPVMGEVLAAQLQSHMIVHTISNIIKNLDSSIALQLWCAPDMQHELFTQINQQYDVSLFSQEGDGLGERMKNAAKQSLNHYQSVLIIGTDCPLLVMSDYLLSVISSVRENTKVVIGPADDGGYVCLGLNNTHRPHFATIFEDIPWGTSQVLSLTENRMQQHDIRYNLTEELWDVDRPGDLERLKCLDQNSLDKGFSHFIQKLDLCDTK